MRNTIKLCAGLLAALLLVTGCGGDRSWVYKSGDVAPPAGVFIALEIMGVTEAAMQLSEDGNDAAGSMSAPQILEQTVEGQPADQWVEANAENALREYIAVEQQFAAEGGVLPEASVADATNSAANEWGALGPMYEENGVAQSSLELLLLNNAKRTVLFGLYYDEGGKTPVPDDELKAIMAADYAKTRVMNIPKATADVTSEDGSTVTETIDEQNAATKAQLEGYQKRMAEGEPMLDMIVEYETAEADGAELEPHDDSSHVVFISEALSGTYYSEELVNGALALAVGSTTVLEDSSSYYLIERLDALADPADYENLRPALLSELKSEEFNAMIEGWAAALTLETNQPALDHYTVKRLKVE